MEWQNVYMCNKNKVSIRANPQSGALRWFDPVLFTFPHFAG